MLNCELSIGALQPLMHALSLNDSILISTLTDYYHADLFSLPDCRPL